MGRTMKKIVKPEKNPAMAHLSLTSNLMDSRGGKAGLPLLSRICDFLRFFSIGAPQPVQNSSPGSNDFPHFLQKRKSFISNHSNDISENCKLRVVNLKLKFFNFQFSIFQRRGLCIASPSEKGFSLIELLIVITIINIIASIIIPNYIRARDKAYYTGCLQSLIQLRLAENLYLDDHDTYADTGLGPYFFGDESKTDEELEALVQRSCTSDWTVANIVAAQGTYEIQGVARDACRCEITVTPQTYYPAAYGGCCEK